MMITCQECKHKGKPVIKMGGLVCSKCRVIIKYPTDPEYKEALLKAREKK